MDLHILYTCSPSCDSCRHCGVQTPSHTAYICTVCPRCGWSYEPSPGPNAWMTDYRSHRCTVASLISDRLTEIISEKQKHEAKRSAHRCSIIVLPECVIMWRFSWFVEMNFLSQAWHSNISCIYGTRAKNRARAFEVLFLLTAENIQRKWAAKVQGSQCAMVNWN